MKNINKKRSSWFISSILITILGAMSILLLFLMQYYETRGIFFWATLASWIIILIVMAVMFCVQEGISRKIEEKQNDIIQELKNTIEELEKGRT